MLSGLPLSSPLLDKVHPFPSSFNDFLAWIIKESNSMKPDTSLGIGCSATTENNTGIEHDSRRRFQEKSVLLAKVELLH